MSAPDSRPIVDLQRTFIPPRELAGSRPRDVELTAGGRALYLLAFAMFTAAIVAGMLLYREGVRQAAGRRALAADGVDSQAEVTRLWRESGDSKQPWVGYRYEVSGTAYDGRSKMRLSKWQALRLGAPLPVRYLPADPHRSVVVGSEPAGVPAWLPFLLAAALGSVGVLCLWTVGVQRRLLMEGRPAPALVTALVNYKTSHAGSQRAIKYTFPLLSGAVANGKSEAPRKPPGVGSVICVVYDPDRPRRSRPYPFPFVRPYRPR
jgi:hypothetical protein